MKSIPMVQTTQCFIMDINRQNLIVPVTATRKLQLSGGQSMEQAVPEDYVLSAMVLRAMEQREGRELEFILKSYLPVAIVSSPQPNRFFLVELLGLTSETLLTIRKPGIKKIIEKVAKSKSPDDLLNCVQTAREEVKNILQSTSTTVFGLFAGLTARGITPILDRPSDSNIEDFSVILTGILESSEFDRSIQSLQSIAENMSEIDLVLNNLLDHLTPEINGYVGSQREQLAPVLKRLDLRIEALEKQIESLQSQRLKVAASSTSDKQSKLEELDSMISQRKTALERDRARQLDIVKNLEDISQDLIINRDELTAESQRAIKIIRDQWICLSDMLVPARFDDSGGKKKSVIMIPFFTIGFSRKDQLQVEVYPLSQLQTNGERVSRRRDFVDIFESPSRAISALSALLQERANNDVSFRKFIRDSSRDYNLLADTQARELIRNGAESLLGDGFAKRPLIDELESLLTSTPEMKARRKKRRLLTPIPTDDSVCTVKFHIHDESGKPIEAAELELGALHMSSDNSGFITMFLPRSHYEGLVRAHGYIEKPIEFSLDSTDDVVIPIVVNPLSYEEQLALRLDELVDRSRRLDMIRDRLWEAFEKQGNTLLGIPVYRTALIELLSELGYEPESWINEAKQKSGMVKRLLKRDDRIDGIRRDILRMAEESKSSGGIMLFSELLVRLDNLGWSTGSDEIETIINDMAKEGLIQGLSPLENGALLVAFVPVALTTDPQLILNLAVQNQGKLTIEDAFIKLEWTEERVRNALKLLVNNGVAKEQRSYSRSTQYFFPGLIRGKK